jgi:hypothetical protein
VNNMSFALTTAQILNQTKTVTRRLGWVRLKPGTLLQPIEKGQGLKKGESPTLIGAPIRVVNVRREPLERVAYGFEETAKEGFADHPQKQWPSAFMDFFCRSHKHCTPQTEITRIEFEYTVTLEAAQVTFETQHAEHLRRRAGEEFQREPSDVPRLNWLTCSCGEMTLVRAAARELSNAEASDAVSHAFRRHIERRFGARL